VPRLRHAAGFVSADADNPARLYPENAADGTLCYNVTDFIDTLPEIFKIVTVQDRTCQKIRR
jgi:hypothetical protein